MFHAQPQNSTCHIQITFWILTYKKTMENHHAMKIGKSTRILLGNVQLQTVKLPEGIPDSLSKARRPNAWRGVGTADIGSLDLSTQVDHPVAIKNGKSPKMMG